MNFKKTCAIAIPFYKADLTDLEKISLKQAQKIFNGYDIIIFKPTSLNLTLVIKDASFRYEEISFDDQYFESIKQYNRLMMSADFYGHFSSYDYILIYQLDAFVFKDELDYWCSKGYDYIGAPWLRRKPYRGLFKQFKEKIRTYYHRRYNIIRKDGLPDSERQLDNQVGNGGFSLRKVNTLYKLSLKYTLLIEHYLSHDSSHYNEDIFWSIELNRKKTLIKKPPLKIALQFAVETAPERAFKIINGKIPFGCHAWDKNLDFWQPYFAKQGYII